MQLGGQVLSQHVEPFSCRVLSEGEIAFVAPRGEMDMATVGAVEQELRRVRAEGYHRVVLDLSGVTFMDSTGLHLTARWTNEASSNGFVFELQRGPATVQRVFELAGMVDWLQFRD
jgi:anti-anti-sigma factor